MTARPKRARIAAWRRTRDGWLHDDPSEQAFAIAASFAGFDVIAFDQWVEQLGACAARDELLEWRAKAKAAGPQAGRPFLELLQVRMHGIRREDHLLPLARRAKRMVKPKGAVGTVTAYLRAQRRPGEKPADLWARLKYLRSSSDAPAYFDGDELFDAKTGKTIGYAAFVKRLRVPNK